VLCQRCVWWEISQQQSYWEWDRYECMELYLHSFTLFHGLLFWTRMTMSSGVWCSCDILWARSSWQPYSRAVPRTSVKPVGWRRAEDGEHQQMHLPALSLAIFWYVWEISHVSLWHGVFWATCCPYWKVNSF